MPQSDRPAQPTPSDQPRGRCPHCGYDTTGIQGPTCPECATYLGSVAAPPPPTLPRQRRAPDVFFALACAVFALWLFFAACELSFRVWIDWLILWPVLIVIGVPAFACAALMRPRTTGAVFLAGGLAWLFLSHEPAYAYLLVHWVRSPGVPGSKGLEPETIKAIYRYIGGALLLLTAVLTVISGGEAITTSHKQQSLTSA